VTAGTESSRIRLLLADVDGTLVDQHKRLTDAAVDAVRKLHDADVLFAVTSGRPPNGMQMLIDPLDIRSPIAGFNGGIFVDRDMTVIQQKVLPSDLVVPIAEAISSFDLDVWIYQGADWYVPDPDGPHVDRESTVRFEPKVMTDPKEHTESVAKIVGVSDDHEAVSAATDAVHERFGTHVAASMSQSYYLDVTHPFANKGSVAKYLAALYKVRAHCDDR
jgi:Cof subfamily protein (haloacid dehalogenase superfamily)